MSIFTVTDASQVFSMSDAAAAKVKHLIDAEDSADDLVLRVAVRPGGCSGFSYEMFFDADVAADDLRFDHEGVAVVIDPASFQMLKGAKLDYKDGLQETGFSISNPNAERSCGCGQSFS
jgi:iron-sulfur cluster assembly accessory protein